MEDGGGLGYVYRVEGFWVRGCVVGRCLGLMFCEPEFLGLVRMMVVVFAVVAGGRRRLVRRRSCCFSIV